MRAVITGATGLVGGNLAVLLCEAGHEVVATKRGRSQIAHLSKFPIRWVEADLSNTDNLARVMEGADAVFHCAAAVSIRYEVEPWIWDANVVGTENILAAVRRSGARRLIHCSTVGALGLSETGQPSDESARWNFAEYGLGDAYVSTKFEAQKRVEAAAADGLDAVIVNPTYMFGPYDVRPSSGKLIVDVVKGNVPGYTLGRNNFVDVRDVVRGMLLAYERGRAGERYILGGVNMTYKDVMERIAEVAGVRAPRIRVPGLLARALGKGGDAYQKLTGRDALLNSATINWSLTDRFIFTSRKAEEQLGYQISPLETALRDAITWFREHGMV